MTTGNREILFRQGWSASADVGIGGRTDVTDLSVYIPIFR